MIMIWDNPEMITASNKSLSRVEEDEQEERITCKDRLSAV